MTHFPYTCSITPYGRDVILEILAQQRKTMADAARALGLDPSHFRHILFPRKDSHDIMAGYHGTLLYQFLEERPELQSLYHPELRVYPSLEIRLAHLLQHLPSEEQQRLKEEITDVLEFYEHKSTAGTQEVITPSVSNKSCSV